VCAPEGYVILGSTIYAGAGVGILYANGDFDTKPFYALRAGLDLELLPQLYVDVNVNYRFAEWTNLSAMSHDINADTTTLGAALRLKF
jgi:opacity protein-like surface antigen